MAVYRHAVYLEAVYRRAVQASARRTWRSGRRSASPSPRSAPSGARRSHLALFADRFSVSGSYSDSSSFVSFRKSNAPGAEASNSMMGREALAASAKRTFDASARSEEHTSELQSHSFISYA